MSKTPKIEYVDPLADLIPEGFERIDGELVAIDPHPTAEEE